MLTCPYSVGKDLEDVADCCCYFAKRGFAVLSVDYTIKGDEALVREFIVTQAIIVIIVHLTAIFQL